MRYPLFAFLLLVLVAGTGAGEDDDEPLPAFDRLWDYGDLPATEKAFRDVLEATKDRAPVDYELQLLTQIARTLGLRNRFKEAHALLDDVEKRLTDETKTARVRYHLERGRAYNSANEKDAARTELRAAITHAPAAGNDDLHVDALHMMGIVASTSDERVAWSEKALALVEASEQRGVRGWLGPLYNNLGWELHDREEYDKALAVLRKGVRFREWVDQRLERPPSPPTLEARWAVSRQLRKLKRYEEAMKLNRELLEAWEAHGGSDGFVDEEMAECLIETGQEEEARGWFAKAHAKLSRHHAWLLEEEPERMARLKRLGAEE